MGWREDAEEAYELEQEEARVKVPTSNSNNQAAAKAFQSGASGDVSGGMMSYGAATANPYLLAGGAVFGVLSDNEKRKQQDAQMKADAENQKRANMQSSLQGMAALYGRMKL